MLGHVGIYALIGLGIVSEVHPLPPGGRVAVALPNLEAGGDVPGDRDARRARRAA